MANIEISNKLVLITHPRNSMVKSISISFFFVLFSCYHLKSQDRFKAAAMFGLNFSQIDGDNYEGYHKAGVHFGLRATTILTEQFNFNFEILFTQKGSKSKAENYFSGSSFRNFDLRLNYIEVPLLLSYRFKYIDKGRKKNSFFKYNLMAGISFARLINTDLKEIKSQNTGPNFPNSTTRIYMSDLLESFKKNDIALAIGLSYYFTKHVGLGIRHSLSLSDLYKKEETDSKPSLELVNYFLWAQVFYDF